MVSAGFSLSEAIPSYFILWYSLYLEAPKTGPRAGNSPPQMSLVFYTLEKWQHVLLLLLGEADWGKNKSRDHVKLTWVLCESETENPTGLCALFLFMRVRPSQLHHPIPLLKDRLEDKTAVQFSSVQLPSHVRLFATPWTTACQASLSITNSRSPPKPMSIKSVMPSNHLILCHPLLLLL